MVHSARGRHHGGGPHLGLHAGCTVSGKKSDRHYFPGRFGLSAGRFRLGR